MSKLSHTDLFKLFDKLNAKPYHIHPLYIDITGSVIAGYLLTQLIFIARSFGYDPFYRTEKVLRDTYRLGRYELENARKRLVELGVVTIDRKGVPAKLYYTVNIDKVIELCLAHDPSIQETETVVALPQTSLLETSTLECSKPAHQFAGNQHSNNKIDNNIKNKQQHARACASINQNDLAQTKTAVAVIVERSEKKVANGEPFVFDANTDVLIQDLGRIDITNALAVTFIQRYGRDRVSKALEVAKTKEKPAGWLNSALAGNWSLFEQKAKEVAPKESVNASVSVVETKKHLEAIRVQESIKDSPEAIVANQKSMQDIKVLLRKSATRNPLRNSDDKSIEP